MEGLGMSNKGFLDNYKHVFDPEGLYGGSQKKPELEPEKYASIVRKYHPEYDDEQVQKCLHLLRTEGCGYVAMVNTVFMRFYGEEEEYKKHFGFPMYTPEGKLNFNDLIVDFYCATDNHNRYMWFDRVDPKEDETYENGFGTVVESREWRFETYMKNHGVPVNVRTISCNLRYLDSFMKKGPVIVAVRPVVLYDKDANPVYASSAGHAMTVTGSSENGLIRVSSWGEEYYIKPGSYSVHENYQQVIYRK